MTQQEFFTRYKYNVRTDKIGGGAFGTVYKVYDEVLNREVAIKVSEVKIIGDKEFSLKDEFDAIKGLPPHKNIANYEELFTYEGPQGIFDYAIMQFYKDGNLSHAIKKGFTEEQKEQISIDLLNGIYHLHQNKIVHRDLKPGNILIVKRQDKIIPIITDFGLSKQTGQEAQSRFSNSFGGGTLKYSSPEQLKGENLRLNTDLWAYGVIVYEIFTRENLFKADGHSLASAEAEEEIFKQIKNKDISGELLKLPGKWQKIVEVCIVRDSGKRVKSAVALLDLLKENDIKQTSSDSNTIIESISDDHNASGSQSSNKNTDTTKIEVSEKSESKPASDIEKALSVSSKDSKPSENKTKLYILISLAIIIILASIGYFFTPSFNIEKNSVFNETKSGIRYKIISSTEDNTHVKCTSGMIWKMSMSYGTLDSLIFDFSKDANYIDLPFEEPTYKGDINEALALFSKGDSVHFIIKADSFFLLTAKTQEIPDMFLKDNDLHFFVKIKDIVTAEESETQKQEELKTRKTLEIDDLSEYLRKNYPKLKPTKSGLFIVQKKKGSGKIPRDGERLNFDFSVSILNGDKLYNSKEAGKPAEVEKGKPYDTEGLTEGLNAMRVGDELTLIVPSKLAFKEQGRPGHVEPYTTLIYWVRLNSVQTKAQHKKNSAEEKKVSENKLENYKKQEKVTIANYIKEENITVKPTQSGLYYIETKKGSGMHAVTGDEVKVRYTSTLLDGTKFDSNSDRDTPLEFTIGVGQVIKGWDEGIALMKVGGKATLIVPSQIAYGSKNRGAIIHAYAPLKFDIELVDIVKSK